MKKVMIFVFMVLGIMNTNAQQVDLNVLRVDDSSFLYSIQASAEDSFIVDLWMISTTIVDTMKQDSYPGFKRISVFSGKLITNVPLDSITIQAWIRGDSSSLVTEHVDSLVTPSLSISDESKFSIDDETATGTLHYKVFGKEGLVRVIWSSPSSDKVSLLDTLIYFTSTDSFLEGDIVMKDVREGIQHCELVVYPDGRRKTWNVRHTPFPSVFGLLVSTEPDTNVTTLSFLLGGSVYTDSFDLVTLVLSGDTLLDTTRRESPRKNFFWTIEGLPSSTNFFVKIKFIDDLGRVAETVWLYGRTAHDFSSVEEVSYDPEVIRVIYTDLSGNVFNDMPETNTMFVKHVIYSDGNVVRTKQQIIR